MDSKSTGSRPRCTQAEKNTSAANSIGSQSRPNAETIRLFAERGSESSVFERGKAGEIFTEDNSQERESRPWWKINLIFTERVLFGTWDGVFTSCMLNLIGAILFLRMGWIIGEAGIFCTLLVTVASVFVGATTTLSIMGVLATTDVQNGGVFFLISHVLGSKTGGAIGLMYCVGQVVSISLSLVGFGESLNELFELEQKCGENCVIFTERAFASGALILLTLINISGVKTVVKMQGLFGLFLIFSVVDFFVGVNMNSTKYRVFGYTGWSNITWHRNLWPKFSEKSSWFTVLGVFFPSVSGFLAGLNMSADLKKPYKNISIGTLSALGLSLFLYMSVVVCLGGTVSRDSLKHDFLIMENVSASGILLLVGLYTSTVACPLASLYGTPRIFQSIAAEGVIPLLKPMERGIGPNKVPVFALIMTSLLTLGFVMIGEINVLAPIATVPFLITYATMDYANFALSATYETDQLVSLKTPLLATPNYKSTHKGITHKTNLDELFPDRVHKKVITRSTGSTDSSSPEERPGSTFEDMRSERSFESFRDYLIGEGADGEDELRTRGDFKSRHRFSLTMKILTNKWLSLLWAILKILLVFTINWLYGLISLLAIFILYSYIATTAPGVPAGIASRFKVFPYLKRLIQVKIYKKETDRSEIVITPQPPGIKITQAQLTQENQDFSLRSKFHEETKTEQKEMSTRPKVAPRDGTSKK